MSALIRSAILVCCDVIFVKGKCNKCSGSTLSEHARGSWRNSPAALVVLLDKRDNQGCRSVQKKYRKSVKDTCFLERVVGTVLGDGAQSLAGKLHAKVATLATVELGHPDTLLLEVGVNSAVHHFGDVTADTTLLLGKTGTMNAAALVRHGKCDVANTGHKMF